MQIKRLEIVGFKSFVDRVSLDFNEGIAAVVGPNGCGKSNILDAIRWVMGEQSAKKLRGRSMEDVIFGGSETRKPVGMAEVSMIFSNEQGLGPPAIRDYPEIMVTRRLYRNGDSEYRLNKTPCRLLDITELFMDTGVGARAYSIIEQGKIGMILNAKPEDRRFLIEEAAGISKFKARKQSALRKIDATRQNLLRLRDIISEVRRQLNALKRQARKAEQYRDYREELKSIEVGLAAERYRELDAQQAAEETAHRERSRRRDALDMHLQKEELEFEKLRLLQANAEKELAQKQEQFFHLTASIQKVESRIDFDQKAIAGLQRQQERLVSELESLGQQLAETDHEETVLRSSESNFEADLARETERLANGEAALAALAAADEAALRTLEEDRQTLFALSGELSRLDNRSEEVQRHQQALAEKHSRNTQEQKSIQEQQDQLQKRVVDQQGALGQWRLGRAELQQNLEEAKFQIQRVRQQMEEGESLLLQRQEVLSRRRSRLESLRDLESNLEGYQEGVQTLMADTDWYECCDGLVADLLEVPAGYEVALEAVLGDRLQALLPNSSEDVWPALELLRSKGGRGAFLLPEADFAQAEGLAVKGGVPLNSLISPKAGAEQAVSALLEGLFLVEELDPFLQVPLPWGVTLVTPGGDCLSHRGLLQGGANSALNAGLLHKRREMKELATEVDSLEQELAELHRQRQQQKDLLAEAEGALQELASSLHAQELRLADGEKDLARLLDDSRRLKERVELLKFEEEQLSEETAALQQELVTAESGRSEQEQRKAELEQAVAVHQADLQERRLALARARDEVTALKVALAGLRERGEGNRRNLQRLNKLRQEAQQRLLGLRQQQKEAVEELEQLQQAVERHRLELDVLLRRRDEESTLQDTVKDRFEESAQGLRDREVDLKELRKQQAVLQEELTQSQVKLREIELETGHLLQTVLDRYRVDLSQEPTETRSFDEAEAEKRLQELRRLLDDMGEVNLMAIEEFSELEERWTFLTEQEQDLQNSMESLQSAIAKINRTTRKRFRETFDQVNKRFQEVFPRLFLGGKAELKLTDEQDLLETGIDIAVQPPGKKLQSVNLLSGGEKALTAVALIFAIFLIKPSPFCILDEVDAPLDDANISRFNGMVKEMSSNSQFIIITHNKRTMAVANTLYGVTMESPGVSKLVSVRINDF
ncbi:chromosome segregation protein SMC [Syntrophotalea acetylenivorans]|uniref:Chromosome partition protein Smc n=1 Tax=Syntrophotalea acetylenivorans TaxID=1842532 RepID=A0A1L3GRT5_9BACT|nr:chromosome segregation protein SMC [Syntrophotalea acetylenivorans]APG28639.1 chromosome segregation protein SMC [Syntrophotalea acetylenivorans]